MFGVFFQIIATFSKKRKWDQFATYLFVGGLLTGIVTFLAGKNDEDFAEDFFGKSVEPLIEQHEIMAFTTLIVFAALLILKFFVRDRKMKLARVLILLLALKGAALISLTGHLGGQIVYGENQTPFIEIDDDFFKFEDWFDF